MGRFYIRVIRDGIRERTWGCGSRGENNQHYKNYLSNLLNAAEKYRESPESFPGVNFGKKYRLELIKNRHSEKELYREIEIELVIPEKKSYAVYYVKCKDVTHITEGFDPRILTLPPDW